MVYITEEVLNTAFEFIIQHFKKYGYAPSVREVAAAVGNASSSTGNRILNILSERDLIKTTGSPRAIKVVGYEFVKKKEN